MNIAEINEKARARGDMEEYGEYRAPWQFSRCNKKLCDEKFAAAACKYEAMTF